MAEKRKQPTWANEPRKPSRDKPFNLVIFEDQAAPLEGIMLVTGKSRTDLYRWGLDLLIREFSEVENK